MSTPTPNPATLPIVLLGGGGHCLACIDVLEQAGAFAIRAIVDLPASLGREVMGHKIEHTDFDLPDLIVTYQNVLVCLGQIKTAEPRRNMFRKAEDMGATFPSPVSPHAYVSPAAAIGEGTIVMHQALVNAEAEVGFGCIINSKALVEHGARVGNFCHIATGAALNGDALVGEGSFVGSLATVAQGVKIGAGCIIGAGAVVLADVPAGKTVSGVWK